MKDGLSAEALGKIIAQAEAHGAACAVAEWQEQNMRRVDIQGRTVYVLGADAQAHLEKVSVNLIKGKFAVAFAVAEMRHSCAMAAKWAVHDVSWPHDDRNLERRNLAAKAIGEAIEAVPLTREEPT